jgi:hypothetical protein
LIAGIGLGVVLATYWPHEPAAFGQSPTAVSGDKFAMCTVMTTLGDADGLFILDFTTGRLVGAVYNNKIGEFSQPLIRNIAQDFNLTEAGDYIMCTGYVGAKSSGGQPAQGGVYIAELTTGKVALYGFINVTQGNRVPQQLTPMGFFPWRGQ